MRIRSCIIAGALFAGVITPATAHAAQTAPNYEPTLWGLAAVRAAQANTVTTGSGVTVAVIDTGVDGTHPDLQGRVLAGWSTVSSKALVANGANDPGGHGTHVAGIIAGAQDGSGIAGVAPAAQILPVQVLDEGGSGSDRTVSDGIDWAVANGAQVINLSLGGGTNPFDQGGSKSCAAVGRAFDAGVVVIVAAGNAGAVGNPRNEPASCRGAVSVAAVDEMLNRTAFSSYDATVAISAPGAAIISSVPMGSRHPYEQMDGTSMAAPHVAGVAALIRAAHPDWTAQQVVDMLISTAIDLGPRGNDPQYGAGIVDAAAAVGLERASRELLEPLINARSLPVVIRSSYDGKKLDAQWFAPKRVDVTSYTIRTVTAGKEQSYPVPGNVTRASFNAAALPDEVYVVADVAGSQRVSFVFYDIEDRRTTVAELGRTNVTGLKATWTKEGIVITFVTKGPLSTVTISVNAVDGDFFAYETVPSTTKRRTYKFAADDITRSKLVDISVSANAGQSRTSLPPQYQIAARALTAGSGWVSVTGSTREACLSKQKLGCSGAQLQLRDAKTGKVIATTTALGNFQFGFDIKRSKAPAAVYVTIGSARSAIVDWKPRS